MSNKFKKIIISSTVLFLPVLVLAAGSTELGKTKAFFVQVQGIINILIPIAFALALLFFFWGIAKYIWSVGSGKEDGKKIMLWGVIAIFVMSSIWGIVAFIGGSFGLDPNATTQKIPTIGGAAGESL